MFSEQNEIRRLLAYLLPDNDQVASVLTQHYVAYHSAYQSSSIFLKISFSQGLLEAQVATVDEVEEAVALDQAGPGPAESDSAAHFPASPRGQTSVKALSSSSSSDFIVLSNDSDSDFVVHDNELLQRNCA